MEDVFKLFNIGTHPPTFGHYKKFEVVIVGRKAPSCVRRGAQEYNNINNKNLLFNDFNLVLVFFINSLLINHDTVQFQFYSKNYLNTQTIFIN